MTIFTTKRTVVLILLAVFGIVLAGIGFLNDDLFSLPDSLGSIIPALQGSGPEAENDGAMDQEDGIDLEAKTENGELRVPINPVPQGGNESKTSRKDDFFANYRLERERVRSQQVEMLNKVVADPNSDAASRAEAQKKLIDITGNMEKELQLESLIKAKGFNDAAMVIQPGSATAILQRDGLIEEDVNAVAEIISRVTGYNLEDIVVVAK